jgi:hypothetical protein
MELPHDGAHALADARVPSLGGVQGEPAVGDVVGAVPSARHVSDSTPTPISDTMDHKRTAIVARLARNACRGMPRQANNGGIFTIPACRKSEYSGYNRGINRKVDIILPGAQHELHMGQ